MNEIMTGVTWIAKVGVGVGMVVLALKSIAFVPILGPIADAAGNVADMIFQIKFVGPTLAVGAAVGSVAMIWYIATGWDILGLGSAVTAPGAGLGALEGGVREVTSKITG